MIKEGRAHPRAAEGERTKKEILRIAVELFAEYGYAKTTITQIADRANTYRSSVDWHFGSKEGLLLAVIDNFLDEEFPMVYRKNGESIRETGPQEAGKIKDFFFNILNELLSEHFLALRAMFRLTFEEMPHNPRLAERLRSFWAEFNRMLVDTIKEGKENGSLRPEINPAMTAQAILALGQGLFMQWYLNQENIDNQATIQSLVNGISRLLMIEDGAGGDY